jgi:hypothetical protein
LYEKGTKSRVIAIGDYFTQTCLTPVHDTLASIIKVMRTDGTFDQDGQFNRLLQMTAGRKDVYSLDLSKATDRLPLAAQVSMLTHLLGNKTVARL